LQQRLEQRTEGLRPRLGRLDLFNAGWVRGRFSGNVSR
jgi:hypothetical protein